MEKLSKRILILATHPDDEVLSFGGLIQKELDKGSEVYIKYFCVGGPCSNQIYSVRKDEAIAAMNFLGVDNDHLLFPYEKWDGLLDTIPTCSLTGIIDKLINELKPEEVYCSPDSEHGDHHALYKAFVASARLKEGFMPKLFAVGTYVFSDQLYNNPMGGKIFNPLTDEQLACKCRAFELFKSQCKESPSPLGINGVKLQSEYLGLMCGAKYAELYFQLRYIRS